ncbi:MAG: Holliday junction branch migration protein RuvA [Sphingobacteriales bacterium]|jgi:Holliday junction DNA helicase RuvA|nr:Holliday junction branch migration protein RuvA [Sphingobacteriales bacterium]
MIHHIKGKLVQKTPTNIVVEASGVGYFINISLHTYAQIVDEESILIYTYLNIREDAHVLYGFFDESERRLFTHLISVSGIGPNTARMMLSSISPQEIQEAIVRGDVALVQKIKGIGPKSAQRLILELQDKLKKEGFDTLLSAPLNNTAKEEALSALIMLGFAKNSAEKVLDQIIKVDGITLSVERLIKSALKNL